jgi:hypothetical protein
MPGVTITFRAYYRWCTGHTRGRWCTDVAAIHKAAWTINTKGRTAPARVFRRLTKSPGCSPTNDSDLRIDTGPDKQSRALLRLDAIQRLNSLETILYSFAINPKMSMSMSMGLH